MSLKAFESLTADLKNVTFPKSCHVVGKEKAIPGTVKAEITEDGVAYKGLVSAPTRLFLVGKNGTISKGQKLFLGGIARDIGANLAVITKSGHLKGERPIFVTEFFLAGKCDKDNALSADETVKINAALDKRMKSRRKSIYRKFIFSGCLLLAPVVVASTSVAFGAALGLTEIQVTALVKLATQFSLMGGIALAFVLMKYSSIEITNSSLPKKLMSKKTKDIVIS